MSVTVSTLRIIFSSLLTGSKHFDVTVMVLPLESAVPSAIMTIVLMSSIYGHVAPDMRLYEGTTLQNPAAYGASKAGLGQLGRYLAAVCAPHVRVNTVTPGGVWRNQPKSFVERYERRVPLGRMAREDDLTGAVAFLASDLSSYVTGHDLVVDGGWTAW